MASATVPPTVEGKSLSTINFLAANPPQYPNNPTQRGHESLTLYISRVPGTRDVILSTFRPQRKKITGEDVANSLYYVHLDHPDDSLLIPPRSLRDDGTPRSSGESQGSSNVPIKRKPLPASARVPSVMTRHGSETSDTGSLSPFPVPLNLSRPGSSGVPAPLNVPAGGSPTADDATPNATSAGPPLSAPPAPDMPRVRFVDVPTEIPQTSVSTPRSPPAPAQASALRPHPRGPRNLVTDGVRVNLEPPQQPDTPPPPYSPSFDSILSQSQMRAASPPEEELEPQRQGHHRPHAGGREWDGDSHARASEWDGDSHARASEWDRDASPPAPVLPPRPRPGSQQEAPPPALPPRPDPTAPVAGAEPFSLSLIRRDPTTGNQWNVGKVVSVQNPPPPPPPQAGAQDSGGSSSKNGHNPERNPPQMGQPINILVESSGYAKFRGMPSRASFESGHLSLPARTTTQAPSLAPPTQQEGFHRQVLMSYTRGFRTGVKQEVKQKIQQHMRERAHSSAAADATLAAAPGHARRSSANSISSTSSTSSTPSSSTPYLIMHPSPGYRPAGYTFCSPWDGRCEFRTGNAGRSLKLRHVLPEAVATGDPDPLKQVFGPGAAPVSELRFNLPGADLFAPGSRRGKIAGDVQGKFNKYIRKQAAPAGSSGSASGSDDDWEEWGGEDMDVGKEDAGGGSRGKRVKMGKLIVHDEGMKMLDLVVAANVGVWWSAWERISWERTTTKETSV